MMGGWFRSGAAAFALLAALTTASAKPASRSAGHVPIPIGDLGTFLVTRAIINPGVNPREVGLYRDDPRYVGRVMTFDAGSVAIAYDDGCPSLMRYPGRASAREVVDARMSRPGQAVKPSSMFRTDPDLRRVPTGFVEVVTYRCVAPSAAGPGAAEDWDGVFTFALPKGSLALNAAIDLVLILRPLSPGQPVRASFPCAHARGAAERTICTDPALAGLDRSVAAAFRLAGNGANGIVRVADTSALLASQRAWIRTRDACGLDRQCLADTMSKRTGLLMQGRYEDDPQVPPGGMRPWYLAGSM